jgi:hypothetical protein
MRNGIRGSFENLPAEAVFSHSDRFDQSKRVRSLVQGNDLEFEAERHAVDS